MDPDHTTELTIPSILAARLRAVAKAEQRPALDVLRDAVTLYLEGRGDWSREEEWERARALGLADDDGPLTDDHRHGLRGKIAQGVAAAREGRLVEGEGVFARIEAELDALERLGGA